MAEEPAVRDQWFNSIFGEDGQQPDPEPRSKDRIPKVPTKIREYEKDKKYFDPRVVSLGPYHQGEDHLKPMEKHKITAVKQFVDESRGKILYEKVKELTGVLKEFYDAEVVGKVSDNDFACMMFLDGCFVLHFIESINEGRKAQLGISNDLIPLIIRDMFLIENQLPFGSLDALMNLRWGSSSTGKPNIVEFIKWNSPNSSQSLKWGRVVDGGGYDKQPLHLLDILRTILLDFPPSNGAEKSGDEPLYFSSVMELKETGIRIEKRNMKFLMDISFEENLLFPRLLLPKMVINNDTISQLLNLTTFEACSDTHSGCGVTSYIHFMNSLINDDADVKMLRSKGILHRSLGSDDEVARLFNKWPADVPNDLKRYSVISMQILWHRHRTGRIYITTWVEKYFVAASLILLLTAIQTYFAAFPRR